MRSSVFIVHNFLLGEGKAAFSSTGQSSEIMKSIDYVQSIWKLVTSVQLSTNEIAIMIETKPCTTNPQMMLSVLSTDAKMTINHINQSKFLLLFLLKSSLESVCNSNGIKMERMLPNN